ncbi:helix-turn-helix transcriptional regulator [Olivibacter sitiensis]|uniref:helix-turn-helix transcriptional regulator n=1 Tax=Olivibacter sitiensis TaxID=376470 RepID=UPI00047F9E99|nr:helix-turn-helix transcriptional regulator [Olivibacter sitiensis]
MNNKAIPTLKHASFNSDFKHRKEVSIKGLSIFRASLKSTEDTDIYPRLAKNFRSDFFSIILILEGYMDIKINFEDMRVTNGSLLISDLTSVKQVAKFSDNLSIVGLSFTTDFVQHIRYSEKIFRVMELFGYKFHHVWRLTKKEEMMFNSLLEGLEQRQLKVNGHSFGMDLLINGFTDLLYELAEVGNKHHRSSDTNLGRKDELVHGFLQLATRHHMAERHLSFYGDKLHVSTKYLSETVKEITQKTAGEVLDTLDFMEAKRLLDETEIDIGTIAFEMNFGSPAFFSKFFKRMGGLSPRDYRNRYENKQAHFT